MKHPEPEYMRMTQNFERARGYSGLLPTLPPTTPLELPAGAKIRLMLMDFSAVLDVLLRPVMVVGRRPGPDDPSVDIDLSVFEGYKFGISRQHATLKSGGDKITIMDCDSTNGTFINRYILKPFEEYPLKHGDVLTLGFLEMRVHFL